MNLSENIIQDLTECFTTQRHSDCGPGTTNSCRSVASTSSSSSVGRNLRADVCGDLHTSPRYPATLTASGFSIVADDLDCQEWNDRSVELLNDGCELDDGRVLLMDSDLGGELPSEMSDLWELTPCSSDRWPMTNDTRPLTAVHSRQRDRGEDLNGKYTNRQVPI